MIKKALTIATFTLLGSTAVQASDLFKPDDAVKYRQAIYQVFAAQTGVIGGMSKGDLPFDAAEINKRAKNIAAVAPMLGETYFPETKDVKGTKLKASAWADMEGMGAKGNIFGKALGELIAASAKPDFDLKKARPAVGALLQGCKGCHDDYRAK